MGIRLKARTSVDELAPVVSALSDEEWRDLCDLARGESLIPLSHLVLDGLSDSVDGLARRLGDVVVLDDVGRRAVTRDVARELFAERARRREQARSRDAAMLAAAAGSVAPLRDRIRQIAAAQRRQGGGLLREES